MRPATTTPTGTTVRARVDSPIGPLTLTATGTALTHLYMEDQRHAPPALDGHEVDAADHVVLSDAADQLERYFAGDLTTFDVPLELAGTAFQRQVWAELRRIPHGEVITYGELARRVGNANAFRAVGLANGRNPVAVIVPCHRVVAAGGKLGGYGGGLDRKSWLLRHEGAALRPASAQAGLPMRTFHTSGPDSR